MSIATQITRLQGAKAALKTSIEGKGVEVPEATKIDGYAALVDAIQQGGGQVAVPPSDVNFYDYDGTIVAAYTAEEFAALEALPANPSHDGLTAQGWNWTLASAQEYVSKHGRLDIGQLYITADGKTRLYIRIPDGGNLHLPVYWIQGASCTIDWGDGTTESTTGTGAQLKYHDYSLAGDYVITIDCPNENIRFSQYGPLLSSYPHINYLRKIELGSVTGLGGMADYHLLESVTIPNTLTAIDAACFTRCYSLKHFTLPSGITSITTMAFLDCYSMQSFCFHAALASIAESAFSGCRTLRTAALPDGLTAAANSVVIDCASLLYVNIPDSLERIGAASFARLLSLSTIDLPDIVTNIGSLAFSNLYSLQTLICRAITPPTIAADTLQGINSAVSILVPAEAVEDYKAAQNWSVFVSNIQAIPTE